MNDIKSTISADYAMKVLSQNGLPVSQAEANAIVEFLTSVAKLSLLQPAGEEGID
jgi:hypothetical protein